MASSDAVRRRRGETLRRSRTTSDFERLRPRDSASISATSASGSRTVSVFMGKIVLHDRHRRKKGTGPGPHAGPFEGHPPRPPHQEQLEVDELGGAVVI